MATFSLCLLAQAYELSCSLILQFAEVDVTVNFLMQIDKLIQLLESPIFIHLRLQMLDTEKEYHPPLMKSLYGLLMLLPQSAAYKTLRGRLNSVTSMASALHSVNKPSSSSKKSQVREYLVLQQQFETTQAHHSAIRAQGKDLLKKNILIIY